MLIPIHIKATSLSDAWFQTLYKCIEVGREFKIDQGSFEGQKRLEFDHVEVHITHPDILPLLPQLAEGSTIPNPVADDYLDDYLPYLMTGEEKKGEAYTYGQRLCKAFFKFTEQITGKNKIMLRERRIFSDDNLIPKEYIKNGLDAEHYVNQMELMIWTYKNKGYRNNQMCLQIAQPSDMLLQDPPCLRHIDTRIQDSKLHFFPYFRSWDLFGGFPANLAAIELMKQYCANEIGVGNGEIIATSKGLHIYDYVFEIAEAIRGKSIVEFAEEAQEKVPVLFDELHEQYMPINK